MSKIKDKDAGYVARRAVLAKAAGKKPEAKTEAPKVETPKAPSKSKAKAK